MYCFEFCISYATSWMMTCRKSMFYCVQVVTKSSGKFFTPQPLRAVGILFFHPWCPDKWLGGREDVCPRYISETVRCRKLILGRDIG